MALAPVVVITAVGVPVMFALSWPALLLPLALNIGGAVGDLWMVTTLRRFPTSVTVVDDATGLSVYGDAADTPPAQPRGVVRAAAMGFGVSVGILILLALLAPILLDVAGVTALSLGPPETPWSIFQFESGPDGFSSSLGLGGILGVSGAVGLAYGLFAAGRTPTA
ncbi:DUF3267 domain-containing protein [Haladaptatus sp. GCM10025707]|uniref:DUF3267 domain-containing protein n=1 Tax=Haladaptatus sp. GCM10025707 TaxID=3252658 RepID=UPI003618A912